MSDASYSVTVYDKQGSTERVYESGGKATFAAGSYLIQPSSAEAEGTTMSPTGMSIIAASSSDTYTIPAPVAGVTKHILVTGLTTGKTITVNTVSGTFAGSGSSTELIVGSSASTGNDQIVSLFAQTTAIWSVLSKSTGVEFV